MMKCAIACLASGLILAAAPALADPMKRAAAAEAMAQQGKFKEAVAEAKIALAEAEAAKDELAIAASLSTLGGATVGIGDLSGGEPMLKRAWEIREAKLGPDHLLTAKAINDYATILSINGRDREAEPLVGRAAAVLEASAKTESERLDAAEVRGTHGMTLMAIGRWSDGERVMLAALDRLAPHEDVKAVQIMSFNTILTSHYVSWGRYQEALERAEKTLALRERLQGKDHPHLVGVLNMLGQLKLYLGDETGAEASYQRGLRLSEKAYPDGRGPYVGQALIGLGNFYVSTGSPERAIPLYQRVIADYERGGDVTWRAGDAYRMAALAMVDAGRPQDAKPYAEKAVATYAKALTEADERVGTAYLALAAIEYRLDRVEAGEAAARKGLEIYQKGLTAENPRIAAAYRALGQGARLRGDLAAASGHYEEGLKRMEARWPDHVEFLILNRAEFAQALLDEGRDSARAYRVARLAADPMRDRAIAKSRLLGRAGAPGLTEKERDVFFTAVRAAWQADAAAAP